MIVSQNNPLARLSDETLKDFVRMEGAFGRGLRAAEELKRRERVRAERRG